MQNEINELKIRLEELGNKTYVTIIIDNDYNDKINIKVIKKSPDHSKDSTQLYKDKMSAQRNLALNEVIKIIQAQVYFDEQIKQVCGLNVEELMMLKQLAKKIDLLSNLNFINF